MARIRQLKPTFFLDEDIAELTPWARLLFQGLWTLADKEGRLEEKLGSIRVQVFPFDNLEAQGVSMLSMIESLAAPRKHSKGAFITRYTIGDTRYIQINAFAKHQKCHPKETASFIPGPAVENSGKPDLIPASKPESESESASESESGLRNTARPSSQSNPLVDRDRLEAEFLTLVREIALLADEDPLETVAKASGGKSYGIGRKVNPASMSPDRLANTVLDLRERKRELQPKQAPPADLIGRADDLAAAFVAQWDESEPLGVALAAWKARQNVPVAAGTIITHRVRELLAERSSPSEGAA